MSYCSPKKTRINKPKNTCLDSNIINEMVEIYNQSDYSPKIDISLSSEEKLHKLEEGLRDEVPCHQEYCLSVSPTLKPIQRKLKSYFRPFVPKEWKSNRKTWLNTLDIHESLSQYEQGYPDFYFIAVSPIDFDSRLRLFSTGGDACVTKNLCTLDIGKTLKDGKYRMGAVFNLDKHNQSGSHWTSLFADLRLGECYYFDSVANYIPPEVVNLMLRIEEQTNAEILAGNLRLDNLPKRLILHGNGDHAQISMTDLCNFLLKAEHFADYRFGYMFENVPKTRFLIQPTDKLVGFIMKKTLCLIDLTKNNGYIDIPDLDKIISMERGGEVASNDFAMEWTQSQVSVAISNLVSSIKVLVGGEDNNQRWSVESWQVKGSNIILKLNGGNANGTLTDSSMKCFKNFVQHQFKNTECGMYSINFIDTLLTTDKTFNEIVLNPMDDQKLNDLRYSKYYTPV